MIFVLSNNNAFGQDDEQRIINKVPKHLPIEVEIINGDMKSKLEDVKIKIKNIGDKPIFYLRIDILTTEDSSKFQGRRIGLPNLKYGNPRLGDFTNVAEEGDISLKPDEEIIFEIKEKDVENLNKFLAENFISSELRFELMFQMIHFGDKTGFIGDKGKPYLDSSQKIKTFNLLNTQFSQGFFFTI
jgi:hypothetical protein